jgi:hypothetical protein
VDRLRWYHANQRSAAVPEGFSDEEAIRAIWREDSRKDPQNHPTPRKGD